jgi:exopolysaccharide production protein ExoQ
MSTAVISPAALSNERRNRWAWERADYRARAVRIFCAILLRICFWYSVPYGIPEDKSQGLQVAAAQAAQNFEGSRSRQIAVPLIAAFACFLLWRFPRRGAWKSHLRWPVIAFVLWAVVSFAWSDVPPTTGKRLVVFLCDALFAYTLARIASAMEIALWGFLTTGAVAVISLGTDIFYTRDFAPFNPDYRFMGVMEANYQAANLLVSMICAMTLLQRRPRWAKWLLPFVGLELLTIMLIRVARAQWQPATRALAAAGFLAVVIPVVVLAAGNAAGNAQSLFMMGRTDTENTSSLSNRAPLWAEVYESIQERPVLGFGYAGYWTPERVDRVSLDQGWAVPNAHDTYLDQWLSLGFIGLVLFCASVWGACLLAWQRYRRDRTPENLFFALMLTWLPLASLAESVPLDPYLPSMLAYACIAKMCLLPGTEPRVVEDAPLVQGLPPETQPA